MFFHVCALFSHIYAHQITKVVAAVDSPAAQHRWGAVLSKDYPMITLDNVFDDIYYDIYQYIFLYKDK